MKKLLARFGLPRFASSFLPEEIDFGPLVFGPVFAILAPLLVAGLVVLAPPMPVLVLGTAAISLGVLAAVWQCYRQLEERIEIARSNRLYAEAMREQAQSDPITGLSNRNGFDAELARLAEDLPLGTKLGLVWMDLKRFREINDSLGHEIGDKVLREAANRLVANAPEDAALCRFASDEFIIAARFSSQAKLQKLAGEICDDFARPFRISGNRIESGAMIGVATMPEDASTPASLMQAADLALYHSKCTGRAEVRFYHNSMTRALARRKEVESELRSAIQRDELSIFFQPIIDLREGRIRGFEALVRWFHPDKGEMLPDEFIPVAEETGLIITLGNWVTREAARAASTWPDDITLAVNLSPVQIKAPGSTLGILAALREAGLDPSRLELEVTESLFLEDDEHTSAFIDGLSEHGVRFSLDDFGTGYSSLRYIHRHPFRTIKVDRSFVSGANTGRRSDAIIRAVAEMGSTLDMEIVAEGLETIDQVHSVREAGCTLGQGYYFSRAVPDYTAAMLLAQERQRLGEIPHEMARKKAS